MTDNPILAAALAYAARGWHIFPCRPGLKVPLTQHGVKDATTDPDTIRAWWTRWPDANIALACGPKSGVYVIDVDLDIEKGVDGWKSLDSLPELPATVRQDTPRGGAHFLTRTDTPPRNKNSFREGIDIRSDGYYIMLAPSIHPNGTAYDWAPGMAPGEIALAEFPDAFRPEAEKPRRRPWDPPEKPAEPPAPKPAPMALTQPEATPIIERARLYLRECEPAVQGHGGHDSLLWAARALVVGFELDKMTAVSLLWNEYNPRCSPPWDPAKAGDTKDFERKVDEAHNTPGEKPRGWLLDECGLRGVDQQALEYGKRLAAGLLASHEAKKKATPPPVVKRPKLLTPSDAIPEWLLNPPGMVGQLVTHINRTAGCYQPYLAVGAALVACGAIMGRRVRDESNGRTNIYGMGVAHSSAGKDHPGKVIRSIIQAAGAAAILGGSRVTSDTAIETALVANPVQLFNIDEAGHFLASIKQAGSGSGGASFLRTIVPTLMELYSTANGLYIGKQRADGEPRKIVQPHACVWCLTSPDVLYKALSSSELKDGWLGRVITFISPDRPRYRFTDIVLEPEALVSLFQAWFSRTIPPPDGTGNVAGALGCYQITIPTQPAARLILEAFCEECYERMMKADAENDPTQYLWGKALENARRVCLTVAGGDRYDNAEITEYHAKYGCGLTRDSVERFSLAVRDNIADTAWEQDKQTLMRILRKAGRTGMSKCDFTRATWKAIRDRKTRDAYISELVEAGMIVFGPHPKHTDARGGWLWAAPYGYDVMAATEEGEGAA